MLVLVCVCTCVHVHLRASSSLSLMCVPASCPPRPAPPWFLRKLHCWQFAGWLAGHPLFIILTMRTQEHRERCNSSHFFRLHQNEGCFSMMSGSQEVRAPASCWPTAELSTAKSSSWAGGASQSSCCSLLCCEISSRGAHGGLSPKQAFFATLNRNRWFSNF